ncbi:heavy-metal-associated domain-containing protein [Mucilaginibacter rubeus]|uniref:Heavy-metal-associated domain-containing protein n=1 Tax=Mucilaginibacter rubeus TaxID=2027860 RepID=A0AAE6MLC7_9SPHI|nr:heavy-metal-associated domain-containing protein [Mucilaginibacter rubeus]QEM07057.1 heavy-metal-associated domain-containing protein [Mucilaginibacter rubeus]QTE43799.1 heavy-metal-associated domain-containing protein [Mucilaginibacter rubeus]QTE50399.1 heavy-metal-associated domain-containing protein [Mucilaginibacter rubeus]QTE55486.1 heavy-metal-associated domain-containing protein [Mucilaginibacter rubeus]QTE65052.1 heavy-metal-associated domain-containing protein [Mucilaginibacter rub
METFKFKTNINCGGCIAAVTPSLDNLKGIDKWAVDTANRDKVLTVQAEGLTAEQIIESVTAKGYFAQRID